MELRDIEYFAVIAECGHLGRAAEALGLGQPALSKSLRRLEQAVQAKLVARTPKGVAITAEGSALLARVRELRLSYQNIGREIEDVRPGRVGHVRIGIGVACPEKLLARAFAALLEDAPGARVTTTVSDNDVMVPALRNGELDLVVNYLMASHFHDSLAHEHLYDDQFVVIASRAHRLAGRKKIAIAELADERWALSAMVLGSQHRLQEAFREAGIRPPESAVECRTLRLRALTVACSDLLDWTSRRLVEQSDLSSAVTILPVKELAWSRPVGLIYRREAYQPPATRLLIDKLKSAVVSMRDYRQ